MCGIIKTRLMGMRVPGFLRGMLAWAPAVAVWHQRVSVRSLGRWFSWSLLSELTFPKIQPAKSVFSSLLESITQQHPG